MLKRIMIFSLCLFMFNTQAQVPAAKMPDFTFFRLTNNSSFSNKDIKTGKKSLIIFFDATCEHCQKALSTFNKSEKALRHVNIYLVSLDRPEAITSFLNKFCKNLILNNKVVVLKDVNNEFIKDFQPRKYPSIFLYSPAKKLLLYEDDETKVPNFLKLISAKG